MSILLFYYAFFCTTFAQGPGTPTSATTTTSVTGEEAGNEIANIVGFTVVLFILIFSIVAVLSMCICYGARRSHNTASTAAIPHDTASRTNNTTTTRRASTTLSSPHTKQPFPLPNLKHSPSFQLSSRPVTPGKGSYYPPRLSCPTSPQYKVVHLAQLPSLYSIKSESNIDNQISPAATHRSSTRSHGALPPAPPTHHRCKTPTNPGPYQIPKEAMEIENHSDTGNIIIPKATTTSTVVKSSEV